MTGSLGDALASLAEHIDHEAGVDQLGRSVVGMREVMQRVAFTLRFLAMTTPASPGTASAAAQPDDLDAFVREQAAQDPAFASEYVQAQHTAQIRAHEDLLAAVWLFISWRHVTERLTADQRELFAAAVEAHSARLAEADPSYGEPVKVERWWAE